MTTNEPAGAVECLLCPHRCRLAEYERGQCRVRINVGGRLHSLVYGRPCAVHVDPIEKKPLYHVVPGTTACSVATAGCCLHCRYCQNWELSQQAPEDVASMELPPERLVAMALARGCSSVAYTYTEPTVFFEYAYDTCVIARERGLLNVNVTSGYIEREPCTRLSRVMDCANVDLKGFSDEFYRTVCGGRLGPVLDALVTMKSEGVHVEVTNLVVPGFNDDPTTFAAMCRWMVANLGADTPLHLSRFHPQYRLRNVTATPAGTLQRTRDQAKEAGLRFVYVGNILLEGAGRTVCPSCRRLLVERQGFWVTTNVITADGRCPGCATAIPGIWSVPREKRTR